jgi:hypothetical protein
MVLGVIALIIFALAIAGVAVAALLLIPIGREIIYCQKYNNTILEIIVLCILFLFSAYVLVRYEMWVYSKTNLNFSLCCGGLG